MRSAASKTLWVGKMTVFLVGLAVVLALVFGAATTALGKNGQPLLLGKKNAASGVTKLFKKGPGTALQLRVRGGAPPMSVNSQGRVANLNADRLDGNDADAFLGSDVVVRTDENDLEDTDTEGAALATCEEGEVATGGGGALVLDTDLETFVDREFVIGASRPVTDAPGGPPTGWEVSLFDFDTEEATGNAAFTVRAYAECTDGAATP